MGLLSTVGSTSTPTLVRGRIQAVRGEYLPEEWLSVFKKARDPKLTRLVDSISDQVPGRIQKSTIGDDSENGWETTLMLTDKGLLTALFSRKSKMEPVCT